MSEVRIGRLTATVADWPDPEVVPRMLQRVADARLDDAVRTSSLPEGEWCVRRVDLDLELDPERPHSALETEWADQIVIALRHSLRDGVRDVVHYERREQALDDLLAGLATGQLANAWAWRQVGLLDPDDPQPGEDPRAVCLRVLGRLPYGVAGTLCRLVRQVGPAAVHRLLGAAGWTEVAALAAREAGVSFPALITSDLPAEDAQPPARRRRAPEEADELPPGQHVPTASDARLARRAQAAVASSLLGAPLRGSGLRADGATLRAWAVLVLAEVAPSALRLVDATALVRAVADLLRPPVGNGLATPRIPSQSRALEPSRSLDDLAADAPARAPAPTTTAGTTAGTTADIADPAGRRLGETTAWGGLLFLLNTAADAGLPGALEEPAFLTRPTGWLVQQLGMRLVPAAAEDPAVLALGGVDPELAAAQAPPDEQEAAALDLFAERWAAVTAGRLRAAPAPEDPPESTADLVHRLAFRNAVVEREPGWVEVRLRLDDVDLDVRRAGLDIDPGWVWWLGQVVRFSYE